MGLSNFSEQAKIVWTLARSEPVEVRLFGSGEARAAYDTFTRRHRHGYLPFLANKAFGVALLELPNDTADSLGAPAFRNLRRRRTRALNQGYTFAPFEAAPLAERIFEINRSAPERQGRPLSPAYTNKADVYLYAQKRRPFFGVFDKDGVLRGYCHAPVLGDVVMMARFLGEYDRLEDGIMYLLIGGVIAEMAARRAREGHPRWMMYDTFVGGAHGMRVFKQYCGFHPYRVRWTWTGEAQS